MADFLGCEERLEGALAHVLTHADAIILDLNLGPRRIESGAQGDSPRLAVIFALVDRLRGVLQEVKKHLLKFVGSAGHRAQRRSNWRMIA